MEKIITRVKALLAMAKDTSSPNEAAIALERARKLVDKYQLENIDELPAQTSEFNYCIKGDKQRYWISAMAYGLARLNDCITKSEPLPAGEYAYSFFGFPEDAETCRFMLQYLVETGLKLYQSNKTKLGLKGLGDKNDFLIGYAYEVCCRINSIIDERNRHIVTNRKSNSLSISKLALVKQRYGEQQVAVAQTKLANVNAYNGGVDAGKYIHLGRFVEAPSPPTSALVAN